jgi:hypothetical protein
MGNHLTYTEVASIMQDNILQSDHAFIAFEPAIPAELDWTLSFCLWWLLACYNPNLNIPSYTIRFSLLS